MVQPIVGIPLGLSYAFLLLFLAFFICDLGGASKCTTMAAIPLSVHTAVKVHRNMTKKNTSSEEKGFHFYDSSSHDVPNWHSTPVKECKF